MPLIVLPLRPYVPHCKKAAPSRTHRVQSSSLTSVAAAPSSSQRASGERAEALQRAMLVSVDPSGLPRAESFF